MGEQGGLKIGVCSVAEDILPLKQDYESVVVTDSVSKIPLVLSELFLFTVLGLFHLVWGIW